MTLLAQAGGDLAPAGAPGRTMKSLDQIEPRTPLIDGAPGVSITPAGEIVVSQPGSYYLTGNHASTAEGITITSDDVTLDLQGFTLSGSAPALGISAKGLAATPRVNIVVMGGTIEGFQTGVEFTGVSHGRIESMVLKNSAGSGIFCGAIFGSSSADHNTIVNCRSFNTGASGVNVSDFNTGAGITTSGNVIDRCHFGFGAGAAFLSKGVALSNAQGTTVSNCSVSGAVSASVSLQGARGSRIANCKIIGGGTDGISILGSAEGNLVRDCTIIDCAGPGVRLSVSDGNSVVSCTIRDCVDSGISISSSDAIRIEGNMVSGITGTSLGISSTGSASKTVLVLGNTCIGQTTNYSLGATDVRGPVVSTTGALGTAGAGSHPWANFSY